MSQNAIPRRSVLDVWMWWLSCTFRSLSTVQSQLWTTASIERGRGFSWPFDLTFSKPPYIYSRAGFKKFNKDDEVIFYCRSGKRSGMAFELARQHGYSGVRNYSGSWLDYEAKVNAQK